MSLTPTHSHSRGSGSARRISPLVPLVFALACLAGLGGCKKKDAADNAVSGKVTLKGAPVAGIVTFIYADGKEVNSPTNQADGTYTIFNPAPGEVKIVVKAMPGAVVGGPKGKESGVVKDAPTPDAGKAVPPPQRYTNASSSPLKYEVKAGKHTHDIPLD